MHFKFGALQFSKFELTGATAELTGATAEDLPNIGFIGFIGSGECQDLPNSCFIVFFVWFVGSGECQDLPNLGFIVFVLFWFWCVSRPSKHPINKKL